MDGIQLTATIDSQDSGTIVAGTTAIDYFSCIPSRPLQKYFTELTKWNNPPKIGTKSTRSEC